MIPCLSCGRHVREASACPFCESNTWRAVAAVATAAVLTACYGVPPDDTNLPVSEDADGDGFAADVDCNDSDAAINPDAVELCADQIDNDCDGAVDDADTEGCTTP